MQKFIDTEMAYFKCFSKSSVEDRVVRFCDDKIPDMYTHNFSLIKDPMSSDDFTKIIAGEIENRKSMNKGFLQVEVDYLVDDSVLKALPVVPQVTVIDYMLIEAHRHVEFRTNENCTVLEAATDKVLEDGIHVDIQVNISGMGKEFATRRANRKAEVYQSSKVSLYVCYLDGEPVGKCELFIDGPLAKVEDFDIMEEHQRKGLGTTVLKHLMERAEEQGAKHVYLIAEDAETAKEMYTKCGFDLVGQKLQLHFPLV